MNMKGLYLILLSFLFGCNLPDMQTGKEVSYYFDQPAQIWEETLPLGNGRIGMMPDGGIERENVVLNEISLWSGSKQDTDNPYAYYSLANIRRLLFEGRNDEAQDLMYKTFVCKGTGSNLGDGANARYRHTETRTASCCFPWPWCRRSPEAWLWCSHWFRPGRSGAPSECRLHPVPSAGTGCHTGSRSTRWRTGPCWSGRRLKWSRWCWYYNRRFPWRCQPRRGWNN